MERAIEIMVKVGPDDWATPRRIDVGGQVAAVDLGRPLSKPVAGVDERVVLAAPGMHSDDVPRTALAVRATWEPPPGSDAGDEREPQLIVRASVRASRDDWMLLQISPSGRTRVHDNTCDVRLRVGERYFVAHQVGRGLVTRYAQIALLAEPGADNTILRPASRGDEPETTQRSQDLVAVYSQRLRQEMFNSRGPATDRALIATALLAIHTPELRVHHHNLQLTPLAKRLGIESNDALQADRWERSLDADAPAGLSVEEYLGMTAANRPLGNPARLLYIARKLHDNGVVRDADIALMVERLR